MNVPQVSGVKINPEGGYTDLVIKIQDEVPEDHCPEILGNLKVSAANELEIRTFILSDFDRNFREIVVQLSNDQIMKSTIFTDRDSICLI